MQIFQNSTKPQGAEPTMRALGELHWRDEQTGKSGAIEITTPKCTVGSSPDSTLVLPESVAASTHLTLVYGKRFIFLRAPYPTRHQGRLIRECLIDDVTELTVGPIRLEVVPANRVGATIRNAKLVRSSELIDCANRLSHHQPSTIPSSTAKSSSGDEPWSARIDQSDKAPVSSPNLEFDSRMESLVQSIQALQSTVEAIQNQVTEKPSPGTITPEDLAVQLQRLGESITDEFDAQLAEKLESQHRYLEQFQNQALEPIEARLDSLASHINQIACQSSETRQLVDDLIKSKSGPVRHQGGVYDQSIEFSSPSPELPERDDSCGQSHQDQRDLYAYEPVNEEQLSKDDTLATRMAWSEFRPFAENEETDRQTELDQGDNSIYADEFSGKPAEFRNLEFDHSSRDVYDSQNDSSESPFESSNASAYTEEFQISEESRNTEAYHHAEAYHAEEYRIDPATSDLTTESVGLKEPSHADYQNETGFGDFYSQEKTDGWAASDSPLADYLRTPQSEELTHDPQASFDAVDQQFNFDDRNQVSDFRSIDSDPHDKRFDSDWASPVEAESADQTDAEAFFDPEIVPSKLDEGSVRRESTFFEKFKTDTTASWHVSQPNVIDRDDDYESAPMSNSEREHSRVNQESSDAARELSNRLKQMLAELQLSREGNDSDSKDYAANLIDDQQEPDSSDSRVSVEDDEIVDDSNQITEEAGSDQGISPNDHRGEESSVSAEEESIEEYMQKLLQRVKKGPEGAHTASEESSVSVRTTVRSRREILTGSADRPAEEKPSVDMIAAIASESSPRRPPGDNVDIDALRELANSNARRAIERSESKRTNTTILLKVAITAFAVAAAALIFLLNGLTLNPPFAGMVAAIIVAVLWGIDCLYHFRKRFRSRATNEVQRPTKQIVGPSDSEQKTESEPVVASPSKGWRPTPA